MSDDRQYTLPITAAHVALALLLLLIIVSLAAAHHHRAKLRQGRQVNVLLILPWDPAQDYYRLLDRGQTLTYANKPRTPAHYVYTED